MIKFVFSGLFLLISTFFIVSQVDFFDSHSLSNETQYQLRAKNYLTKRYGVRNIDVMAYITMTPTINATVIERLTPQKVSTKLTIIGSTNSQLPFAKSNNEHASFSLPGMASLVDASDQSSSNPILMANELAEEREQQLVEQVFYNKETQSISFKPQISSLRLALFLPSELISEEQEVQIYNELNQVLNFENKFIFSMMVKPIQVSLFIVKAFQFYDQVLGWIKSNVFLFILILVFLVFMGVLIQYLQFKMKLKLSHYDKTIVIKDSNLSNNEKILDNKRPLVINSSPSELIRYLTSGVTNE